MSLLNELGEGNWNVIARPKGSLSGFHFKGEESPESVLSVV